MTTPVGFALLPSDEIFFDAASEASLFTIVGVEALDSVGFPLTTQLWPPDLANVEESLPEPSPIVAL